MIEVVPLFINVFVWEICVLALVFWGVWYGLHISQDYRKRVSFWQATARFSKEELYGQFHRCVRIVAWYQTMPRRRRPPSHITENALVLATVL